MAAVPTPWAVAAGGRGDSWDGSSLRLHELGRPGKKTAQSSSSHFLGFFHCGCSAFEQMRRLRWEDFLQLKEISHFPFYTGNQEAHSLDTNVIAGLWILL